MDQIKAQLDLAGIEHKELTRYSLRVPLGKFTNNVTVIYTVDKGRYRIKTNWLLLTIAYSVLMFNSVHSYIYSGPFIAFSLATISLLGFSTILLTETRSRPVRAIIKNLNHSLN
ncbi:hypothetical protein L4C38_08015 [Vibrio kasasachensis]|uniref:hypothetical protein n=1 Tax=Vibrio kasasachensis TaxID=2910248 RepID=UPI003D0E269D